ncbi:EamA family transporter [Leeuwenhoekiella sp. MAR_2009_132]|uniref:EamA family transporter n=1 Tax=Leeuwenhoekiella sp. MAR_2009_132 TaxID=1392489 RepID=UPI00048CC774|nr:EamA family transporter [Leeuwenhoekiella sp. MAR_2009_132]
MSQKNPTVIFLAFFAIYVFWGSTYLWNKMAVTELPPFMLGGFRFCTAGLIIFGIAASLGHSLRISRKQLGNSILAGVLFLSVGNGVFVWALKYIDSGFGALIASMYPLFIILMMMVIQKRKLKKMTIAGVFLGLIGMLLLVTQRQLSIEPNFWLGVGLALTAILSWSSGSLIVAHVETPKNHFVSTAYQMTAAGVVLLLASLFIGEEWSSPLSWSGRTQIALTCLILFGSIAAFSAFNYLLKNVDTEKVSTSAYVNPIIAMFLGWYFLDETITLQSIIAAAILLTGVYFINVGKGKGDKEAKLKTKN